MRRTTILHNPRRTGSSTEIGTCLRQAGYEFSYVGAATLYSWAALFAVLYLSVVLITLLQYWHTSDEGSTSSSGVGRGS